MADPFGDRSTDISSLLELALPGHRARSVERVGEGVDHVAYEVDGELIVRCAKAADSPARRAQVRQENRVLALVMPLSPPAVPELVFAGEDQGVVVYRKLPGRTLLDLRAALPRLDLARFGEVIGEFLSRLHRAPVSAFETVVPRDQVALDDWLATAQREFEHVAAWVPAALRAPIEAFLGHSPPAEPPAVACCHNDLGIEHILAEPNRLDVTGIIDWSDAAIADPAYDLALIYRDLGSDALAAILDHYAPDHSKSFRQRVEFYARCSVFEDVGYGLRPGHDAYLAQARAALHRLF